MEEIGAHKICDVRHCPIAAGLYEQIIPQSIHIILEQIGLVGDYIQDRAKHIILLGIFKLIKRRQKFIKIYKPIFRHNIISKLVQIHL